MRQMLDSVNASAIPLGTELVAGYVDGRYAWTAADWQRHAGSVRVRIAVSAATNAGHVLDVERGDATPSQAPGWVNRRRAAGAIPTVYCSRSAVAGVRQAFLTAGIGVPQLWVADWNGDASIPADAVAHQYASLGPYDVSAVALHWPGVDGPSSGSPPYPGFYTMYGSRGPSVVLIQGVVGAAADGMFGPRTKAAVVAWQGAHGLVADGIVGPITWARMFP